MTTERTEERGEMELPDELPERPIGWTKDLLMHLNFGGKGGAATYAIKNHAGEKMPIGYQYDTRKGGETGFSLEGIEHCMSWAELREMWPIWKAKQRAAAKSKQEQP